MNGVILLNDQHAHHLLGCAGVPHVTTPAADGLGFEQAVWAVIPCMLSRHAIRHGVDHGFDADRLVDLFFVF